MAKPKLGSGQRFADLSAKLAGKGIKDPGALAAKKMASMAKAGAKRAARGK